MYFLKAKINLKKKLFSWANELFLRFAAKLFWYLEWE